MKCPTCGINAQDTPKEYRNGPVCNRKSGCIHLDKETSSLFCSMRRNFIKSIRPINSIAIAMDLANKFRKEFDWCRPPKNKGKCILASDEFSRVLDLEAIQVSVQFGSLCGYTHAWNEVWCPKEQLMFILDLTADQFDFCSDEIFLIRQAEMASFNYKYE